MKNLQVIINNMENEEQENKIINIIKKQYGFKNLIKRNYKSYPCYIRVNMTRNNSGYGNNLGPMGKIDTEKSKVIGYAVDNCDYDLIDAVKFIEQHKNYKIYINKIPENFFITDIKGNTELQTALNILKELDVNNVPKSTAYTDQEYIRIYKNKCKSFGDMNLFEKYSQLIGDHSIKWTMCPEEVYTVYTISEFVAQFYDGWVANENNEKIKPSIQFFPENFYIINIESKEQFKQILQVLPEKISQRIKISFAMTYPLYIQIKNNDYFGFALMNYYEELKKEGKITDFDNIYEASELIHPPMKIAMPGATFKEESPKESGSDVWHISFKYPKISDLNPAEFVNPDYYGEPLMLKMLQQQAKTKITLQRRNKKLRITNLK